MAVRRPPRARHPAPRCCFESLESRWLLTTLLGNETFEFADANGQIIRVRTNGNIRAEFIGANVDENNVIGTNELPGRITDSDIPGRQGLNLGGGIGGGSGIQLIGSTPINDPINVLGVIGAPSDSINLQALASNDLGQTFSLNVISVSTDTQTFKFVQLVQLNNATGTGTVIHSIASQLPTDPNTGDGVPPTDLLKVSTITSIQAADFGPDGLLYFVAVDETPLLQTDPNAPVVPGPPRPRLYTVDVETGIVTQIPGSFGSNAGNLLDIKSITFDNSGTLVGFGVRTVDGVASGVLFTIPTGNTDGVGGYTAVMLTDEEGNATNVMDISAIEIIPGDNNIIYAVRNAGEESRLLRVNRSNGRALVLGALPLFGSSTGRDIEGMTWNPVLVSPFTGTPGVLIGTDQTTDQLVFIDHRNRFPMSNIFTIFISENDGTGSISIAALEATLDTVVSEGPGVTADQPMLPFEGSIGEIRVFDPQAGERTLVSANDGTGMVLIGALTKDISDSIEDEDKVPILEAPITQTFGDLPASFTTIAPGILSAAGVNVARILIGGTVTGNVVLGGSIETFYAGWLITGASDGQFFVGPPTVPGNFSVAGDLYNLLVLDSIGTHELPEGDITEPTYYTGFDLQVNGLLGQVRTGEALLASHINIAQVATPFGVAQREIEDSREFDGAQTAFQNALLADNEFFNNDTLDTPQRIGTINPTATGGTDQVYLLGALNGEIGDQVDYYSLALLAGQTVTVELTSISDDFGFASNNLFLLVFDPDGRLIASDYRRHNAPFRITADRPGEYRFAVAYFGIDVPDAERTLISLGRTPYLLTVLDAGNLTVGGIVVGTDTFLPGDFDAPTWRTFSGDVGTIFVTGEIIGSFSTDIEVNHGNLRALIAGTIGDAITVDEGGLIEIGSGLGHAVPHGTIGLIKSTETMNISAVQPTGFDYQVIESGGFLDGSLIANRAIGVIRAGATLNPVIIVNADRVNNDGVIDLIHVTGDMGTIDGGGPQITTGPGGNVRYMIVDGEMFRDIFFGGGSPEPTPHEPGEQVVIRDDSGSFITLRPTPLRPNPDFNPLDSESPQFDEIHTLSNIRTYGIRGSGGSVLVDFDSSGGVEISTTGPAEIGTIRANGTGASVFRDQFNRLVLDQFSENLMEVVISGGGRVDVLHVQGGIFNRIVNQTGGEIVNVTAESIGDLAAGTLGLARSSTGAAVNPATIVADTFPFAQQHIGIVVSGDIAIARARHALGNFIVDGSIGQLTANSDNIDTPSIYEGIVAPVQVGVDLLSVNIGEGLAPSGTGALAHSGLFVTGRLESLVNQGQGSDIRGDIVAIGGIGSIGLTHGAIIDSDILVVSDFNQSRIFPITLFGTGGGGTTNRPIFDIRSITLSGNGGIIGSRIGAINLGPIVVERGFGILNSTIAPLGGLATADRVIADGYGIRGVDIIGGTSLREINARGKGESVSTFAFTPSVRQSEGAQFDIFSGQILDSRNDLHGALGTSAQAPEIFGVTNTGIIETVDARGSRDLGIINAFQIRSSNFNFANSIQQVRTISVINGLDITTGSLRQFMPASDVFNLNMTIAGRINRVHIRGSLAGNSSISAIGPQGDIRNIRVDGQMDGDINASGRIGKIDIRGDLNGNVNIEGLTGGRRSLEMLKLGGGLGDGSLNIVGNVGTIDAQKSFGSAGDSLTITGDLQKLRVGSLRSHDGAVLALDLLVFGSVNQLDVTGQVDGDVTVHGNFKSMKVTADAATGPSAVNGTVTVNGELRNARFSNRGVSAPFNVIGNIGNFQIFNGDLGVGSTVTSQIGGIKQLQIKNGSLLGSVSAPNGIIGTLDVSNNIGNGVDPLTVLAFAMTKLKVGGSIFGQTTIQVTTELRDLFVGGNLEEGATIRAGSIRNERINGLILGDIIIG